MVQEYTAQEIWSLVLKECESRLSLQTITTWLTPSRAVSLLDEALTVELKNKFTAYYVEQNYQDTLNQAAVAVLKRPFSITFVFRKGKHADQIDLWEPGRKTPDQSDPQASGAEDTVAEPESPERVEKTKTARRDGRLKGTLNPRYTFENFVVGKNSQFAHAAALSVADSPATRYNPLFIYGGVGLGKTHIMQAIGNALLKNGTVNRIKICYISAEEFLNELIAAITSGGTVKFRSRYRQMDVLLIDDIEFLSKKEGTQEELFHTFNTLYENQKQIVLTSDRPPREIRHLEERLRSRFQMGLVADILPPEFETRIAILKKKSDLEKFLIPQKVLQFIAENVTTNVRLLEGSLHYLKHYSDTQNTDITLELAEKVLQNIFDQGAKHITVENILNSVSDRYGMPEKAILSLKRKQSIVEPRQVGMYLSSKLTKLSLPEIAEKFKRKDHTTVLHAVRKIARRCEQDAEFNDKIQELISHLKDKNMALLD